MTEPWTLETLTRKGGTMTAEGWFPHLEKDGVSMPVALYIPLRRPAQYLKQYLPIHRHPLSNAVMYMQPDGRRVPA